MNLLSIGSEKDRGRVDKAIVATAIVIGAFLIAPVTAAVALTTTIVQNRNKKGKFFDNLGDFTVDFAANFAVTYALNGGNDINPNANNKFLEGLGKGNLLLILSPKIIKTMKDYCSLSTCDVGTWFGN